MNSANTDYSSVANLYDSLGHLYSGGQIAATKASQINHISTGDRVLTQVWEAVKMRVSPPKLALK